MCRNQGPAPTGAHLIELAEVVGAHHVRAGTAADAVCGVVPTLVARPGRLEEISRLVAAGGSATILATGLGGHLDVGARPRSIGLLLALDRLNRVTEHSAGDMTIVCEAGCPLPKLQEVLAAAGQWLPIDPPRASRSTVGGLVAANLWGPLRTSQGSVRDLLLGVRVVGPDGAVIVGGGRVVKNVAGYDLPKLHVGALGQLGVLAELVFRVRPRPPVEIALAIPCATPHAGAELALEVRQRVEPHWLVVASAGVFDPTPVVLVGLSGVPGEVAEAMARVQATSPAARVTGESAAELRRRVADFPGQPGAATLRVSVLPTDVGKMLAETAAQPAVAHVALGVVYVVVAGPHAVPSLLEHLRSAAQSVGGTVVVERTSAPIAELLDVWGDLGPGVTLMQRIKAGFDPEQRLAPGRLL